MEKRNKVPARIKDATGRDQGWTVYEFATARDAADFVQDYPECAMPCWKRWAVVDGELVKVR